MGKKRNSPPAPVVVKPTLTVNETVTLQLPMRDGGYLTDAYRYHQVATLLDLDDFMSAVCDRTTDPNPRIHIGDGALRWTREDV